MNQPIPVIKTPAVLDDDGNVIEPAFMEEGVHINALQPIEGADDYLIPVPNKPTRLYAGVPKEQTLFYKFPDHETFREFVPDPEVQDEQ